MACRNKRDAELFGSAGRDPLGWRGIARRKPVQHPDSIGAAIGGAMFIVVFVGLGAATGAPSVLLILMAITGFMLVARHFTDRGRR